MQVASELVLICVLVFRCCKLPQTYQPKTIHIYYVTVMWVRSLDIVYLGVFCSGSYTKLQSGHHVGLNFIWTLGSLASSYGCCQNPGPGQNPPPGGGSLLLPHFFPCWLLDTESLSVPKCNV